MGTMFLLASHFMIIDLCTFCYLFLFTVCTRLLFVHVLLSVHALLSARFAIWACVVIGARLL